MLGFDGLDEGMCAVNASRVRNRAPWYPQGGACGFNR